MYNFRENLDQDFVSTINLLSRILVVIFAFWIREATDGYNVNAIDEIDDDDQDGVPDRLQRPAQFNTAMNPAALAGSAPRVTVQNEDDLAATILYAWIDPEGIGSHSIDVYSIFPNDLVMWTESTKGSRLHRGDTSNGQVTTDTKLATLTAGTNQNVFTRTVYMEANAEVTGSVYLTADVVAVELIPITRSNVTVYFLICSFFDLVVLRCRRVRFPGRRLRRRPPKDWRA